MGIPLERAPPLYPYFNVSNLSSSSGVVRTRVVQTPLYVVYGGVINPHISTTQMDSILFPAIPPTYRPI